MTSSHSQRIRELTLANGKMSVPESIASSAVKAAIDVHAKLIIVLTSSGSTARQVSRCCADADLQVAKYRPPQFIYVLAETSAVATQVEGVIRGTKCRSIESMISSESIIMRAISNCKELGMIKSGDLVVAIHGMKEAQSGATNILRILACP